MKSHIKISTCKVCDETFVQEVLLSKHMIKKHKQLHESMQETDKNMVKTRSQIRKQNTGKVRKHILQTCKVCDKTFEQEVQLSKHFIKKHKSLHDSLPKTGKLMVKTRSQIRKENTVKVKKHILQTDGNDTISSSDNDTFLDKFHHLVSNYIGQLKTSNGIHRLCHNRYLVRDYNQTGHLMPDNPENNVFVRYLPCQKVDRSKTFLLVCLKCDKNTCSFISNTIEETHIEEGLFEEKVASCWHVIAVRAEKDKLEENVLDESPVKVLKADPHTSVCYSEETDSFGIVYIPQSRGATKGRCVSSEDNSCKNTEHCVHALLWNKEMSGKFDLNRELKINNSGNEEHENIDQSKITDAKHDNTVLRKLNFPPPKTTSEVNKETAEDGHQFVELEEFIPREIENLRCQPHQNRFRSGCPKQNGWLHTSNIFIHNYDYIKPQKRLSFYRPSENSCGCRQIYDGFEDMLLPERGSPYRNGKKVLHLFTYSVMMKFTTAWGKNGTPIENFRRQW